MKLPIVAGLVVGMFLLGGSLVHGQTALERLEEQLRRRLQDGPLEVEPRAAQPGYLGAVADDRAENGRGVRIMKVVEGGPAERSGLKEKDLVLAVDGQPIRLMSDLAKFIENAPVGKRLTFDVERGAELTRLVVTLGSRPAPGERLFQDFGRIADDELPPPAAAPRGRLLGVHTVSPSLDAQTRLRLPSALGALVTDVTPGSPAEKAGLRLNDLVVAVNDQVVNRPDDLSSLVTQAGAGRTIDLSFYRGNRFSKLKVRLGDPQPVEAAAAPRQPDALPAPIRSQPVAPLRPPVPADDRARIEVLERMVFELQERVDQLEAKLHRLRTEDPKNAAEPPPPAEPPKGPRLEKAGKESEA